MQSILFITKYQATDEKAWQKYLEKKIDTSVFLPQQASWNFVNFPEKITIDDVRGVQAQLSQIGRSAHIFVFTDMYSASGIVQNALLKILEEPPENVTLILVNNNQRSVLDTIQSRCAIITDHTPMTLEHDLFPSLDELQFTTWPELDTSSLAAILTERFSKNQTVLKKKAPSYSQTAITAIAFEAYSQQILSDLSSKNDIGFRVRVLRALSQATKLLSSNVTPKNVYYFLAIQICDPQHCSI